MSSEIGVLDIKPENVVRHGRLEPGKMFLVDMNEGRIVEDEEIKKTLCLGILIKSGSKKILTSGRYTLHK